MSLTSKSLITAGTTLACALILAAVTALPSAALGSGPARCRTANLRVDFRNEDDALSHRGLNFALRNVGPTTCTLRGYVSLRLLDSGARAMATHEYHFGTPPAVHTVTLHPWHRAFFTMYFAVSGPCPAAVYAWGMRFTPPAASAGLVYYEGRFDLCGPGPAQVGISPLRASPQF
jgi:hypothetical protein